MYFLPWSPGASFGGGNIKLIAPYNVMVIRHKNKQLKEKAIRDAEKVGKHKSNGPEELTVVGIND